LTRLRIGLDARGCEASGTGFATYVNELSSFLEKEESIDLTKFMNRTTWVNDFSVGSEASSIKQMGVPLLSTNPLLLKLDFLLWPLIMLPIAAARSNLELIHCPHYFAPCWSSCPLVVTILDLTVYDYPEAYTDLMRLLMKIFIPRAVKSAAKVIAISHSTKRSIIDRFGMSDDTIDVVHLASSAKFQPLDSTTKSLVVQRARARYGIAGEYLLFVGTIEPGKNLPFLIEVFSKLKRAKRFADLKLVIVGKRGWKYEPVFETLNRLEMQKSVIFCGLVPDSDLIALYNGASVFVYPSIHEGFGIPLLEAMACGVPVVSSNTSSMPEVVGSAGLLLAPTDQASWYDAMTELLTDRALALALRSAGFRRAAEFSFERMGSETVAVYNSICHGDA